MNIIIRMKNWLLHHRHPNTKRVSPAVSLHGTTEHMPWGPELFSRKIHAAHHAHKQKFIHLSASSFWTEALFERIIGRVIDNYKTYYQRHLNDKENIQIKKYTLLRLQFLEAWASAAGYRLFMQAIHLILDITEHNKPYPTIEVHKDVQSDFIMEQNTLNLLGIFHENSYTAENFYARMILGRLLMLDTSSDSDSEKMIIFRECVDQFNTFFMDAIHIDADLRDPLMNAFTNDDQKEIKTSILNVYRELENTAQYLSHNELENLFLEKDKVFFKAKSSAHSAAVSIPIITSLDYGSNLSTAQSTLSTSSGSNMSSSTTPESSSSHSSGSSWWRRGCL